MNEIKIALLCTWPIFEDVFFYKDVGTFIKYISREYNIPAEIVIFNNSSKKSTKKEIYEGIKIIKLENTSGYSEIPKIKHPLSFYKYLQPFKNYIKANAKTLSHVMLFHANGITYTLIKWLKHYNHNIKIYVKGDIASYNGYIQKCIVNSYIKNKIFFSCETTSFFSEITSKKNVNKEYLQYIPNGIDDDFVKQNINITKQKENIILSTARFGSVPKNTELLLDILDSINYKKNWKVILAGPIEKEEQNFQEYINNKFRNSENLRKNVCFIGNITNRSELYDWYLKSKVFIFTSRWESFGLSLLEAAYFGDYIMTTDIGCAVDLIAPNNYGFIAPESKKNMQNIPVIKEKMVEHLQSIIDGKIDIESGREQFLGRIRDVFSMGKIIKRDFYKDFIGK